jgi:hypothetical protein
MADESKNPENPGNADSPRIPEAPGIPEAPETAESPGNPEALEAQEKPGSPEAPDNPALAILLKLEARLNLLAGELEAVRGRLAYVEGRLVQVEGRLAHLEAERDALLAPDTLMKQAIEYALDIAGIGPPLTSGEDEDALAELVRQIKARRMGIHVLSDEERAALEAAWRQGVASQEEVAAFLRRRRMG